MLTTEFIKKAIVTNVDDAAFQKKHFLKLHDSFVTLKCMSARDVPAKLDISFHESRFGRIIVASCSLGISYVAFSEDDEAAVSILATHFPGVGLDSREMKSHVEVLRLLDGEYTDKASIVLSLRCTQFQHDVWQSLLRIPKGHLTTYSAIAKSINRPAAARAVGSAVGSNKAAFIIPCHRVVPASGGLGGFMWGEKLKADLINSEIVLNDRVHQS